MRIWFKSTGERQNSTCLTKLLGGLRHGSQIRPQLSTASPTNRPQPKVIITIVIKKLKVFWSSGRPLLCFSRFWPSENVARIRRVYFAYSRTKSVHTRNIGSNAKGKCVFFVLIAPNDRITSYIAGHWRPGQNFMMFQRTKNETFSKNGNIKNLAQKDKNGAVVGLYVYIFLLC